MLLQFYLDWLNETLIAIVAADVVEAVLLVLKLKFENNDLVLYTLDFLLQFIDIVEDHHPLIGLEAIRDQGCQFLGPALFQV